MGLNINKSRTTWLTLKFLATELLSLSIQQCIYLVYYVMYLLNRASHPIKNSSACSFISTLGLSGHPSIRELAIRQSYIVKSEEFSIVGSQVKLS